MGGLGALVFIRLVWSTHTPTSRWITDHANAIPNDPACIEFVLQDAVAALAVPVDSGCAPCGAASRERADSDKSCVVVCGVKRANAGVEP
jgi:hypothetical protein